ncbi:hypothetical protein CF327_g7406, partial [Tilletia walkeri]
PSLLADLPNHDTISTLLDKHIPPHIRPSRDTNGTPLGESLHVPDLTLAMRTNVWWRIAVYARDRVLGAPPFTSPGRVDLEPAGPNDVCAVLMADHPLTRSAPSSMLFTVPARARVAISHLETDDVPSALRASSFCSNAAGDEQQPYTPSTVRYYAPALDRFGSLFLPLIRLCPRNRQFHTCIHPRGRTSPSRSLKPERYGPLIGQKVSRFQFS